VYEKMLLDPECTIFLALSGAMVPAGMRTLVKDLIRSKFVDVVVCTGASMVHDAIEAVGGHHYRGNWLVDDHELYKYHIFRIYDVYVPEEDYVKLDYTLAEMFNEIAAERRGAHFLASRSRFRIRIYPLAPCIAAKKEKSFGG
jgi:deoxyhypusine synthase